MDLQLVVIIALTFVIHLVGTLAYAFRIAGVRTGHVAIAFSLFNILVLISRTSNSFQGPFLAKRVENAILSPGTNALQTDFALILAAATLATLVGGLLTPTFQRYSTRAVKAFARQRSMPRLILRSVTPRGLAVLTESVAVPRYATLKMLRIPADIPVSIVILNFAATALWTVGVLAAIYAGFLFPDFRVTSSTLSSVINGVATIMLFIFVDPYLSGITDDVVHGRISDGQFRRAIAWLIASRLGGTVAAQFLLIPAAKLIVAIAAIV